MVVIKRRIARIDNKLNLVEARVAKLEAKEVGEVIIKPGTKKGPKPKK